jgi:predicted Zn-dependent protease
MNFDQFPIVVTAGAADAPVSVDARPMRTYRPGGMEIAGERRVQALAFCNPLTTIQYIRRVCKGAARSAGFAIATLLFVSVGIQPALAQDVELIRDTEIERVLKSYEDPLLVAAGIDPATVRLYLVNDPEINAAATQSPLQGEEEDILVNTGTFLQLKTPNQMIGILAHETGHIAGGHLIRDVSAMQKASIPMLIGMAVGIAAMAAGGGGNAGMGAIMLGQQAAESQFMAFSRTQEGTADQMGQKFLLKTHQSGRGMLEVFEKFANDDARSAYYQMAFVSDHPADRERIDLLAREVDASPYKDAPDSPEAIHEFHMIQAKLSGYLSKPDTVLQRYPMTDQSEEGHYARAMAYFRQPDMKMALDEIDALVKLEPKNPYFWEVLGQINVEMAHPDKGIAPYQKSVDLMPDAPLLRIDLAAAQLATEKPALAKPALENLRIALQQENDNTFAWYETAQAYSQLGNEPMANLSTAELDYSAGNMGGAAHFATIAAQGLPKGSPDWQRANDIMAVIGPQRRRRE